MTTASLPDPQPSIYFLTVNYYSAKLVCRLLESIAATADCHYHLVIVNNSVEDRQSAALPSGVVLPANRSPIDGEPIDDDPASGSSIDDNPTGGDSGDSNPPTGNVTVLDSPDNVGFGRGCNIGLDWICERDANALVWLINPDAQLAAPVSLAEVRTFIRQQTTIAILGTAIVTNTGKQWFGGGCFDAAKGSIISGEICPAENPLTESDSSSGLDLVYACDWVSGCSMLIDLTRFECCPRFDPTFFLYYEDFDFCQRYQALGYAVATTHRFSVVHTPSSVTNRNVFNKLHHSTFSYLLVLDRYTTTQVRLWRFLRLVCMAIILLPIKPTAAFGKLYGIARYLRQRL